MQMIKDNIPWADQVQISVELEAQEEGGVVARCPELLLAVKNRDKLSAAREVESLIIYCLTAAEEFGISKGLIDDLNKDVAFDIKRLINTSVH